jgi:hypothetical protein
VLLAAVLSLLFVFGGPVNQGRLGATALAAGLVVGVAWAGLRDRPRLGFRLTIAAAGAIVLLVALSPDALRS